MTATLDDDGDLLRLAGASADGLLVVAAFGAGHPTIVDTFRTAANQ